jgi:hypothetical protein
LRSSGGHSTIPLQLEQSDGVTEEEARVLDTVVEYLRPFLNKILEKFPPARKWPDREFCTS